MLLSVTIRVVLAALLGGATTWLVAYALAIKYDSPSFTGYCTDPRLQFTRQSSPGLTVIEGTEFRTPDTEWRDPSLVLPEALAADYSEAFFPPLVYNARDTRPLFFIQSGWPVRCFWGWDTFISSSTITGDGDGLAPIPGWLDALHPIYLPLPHLPMWRGLLINTAIFGGVWFGVLFVPGLVRRVSRRRRGACMGCGYDLAATPAGQPCPECGKVKG
jgi:hypothetical protein